MGGGGVRRGRRSNETIGVWTNSQGVKRKEGARNISRSTHKRIRKRKTGYSLSPVTVCFARVKGIKRLSFQA